MKEEEEIEVGVRPAWDVERSTTFLMDCDYKVEHTEENEGVVVLTVEQKPPTEEESLVVPISRTIFLIGQHPRYSDEPSAKELLKVLEDELKKEQDKEEGKADDSDTSSNLKRVGDEKENTPGTEIKESATEEQAKGQSTILNVD